MRRCADGTTVSRRTWSIAGSVCAALLAAAGAVPAAAAATVIRVDTLKETAIFKPPGPVYTSAIVGDDGTTGECSLREAVQAANTHQDVFGCPAGDGNDTIVLMPGVYHVLDNLFVEEKVTFLGPNRGLAGNDPRRGPEATLSFDDNPHYAAQVAMFWLGSSGQPNGLPAAGAGTVFDGVEMRGGFVPSNCAIACEIVAILQPSNKTDDPGYTLTNSVIRNFSFGVYLGGRDTITRDLFADNDQVPDSSANGNDIYSDLVYMAHGVVIDDNVFANPVNAGVLLQGDQLRGTVTGGQITHNAILKAPRNAGAGLLVITTTGTVIRDNLITNPRPAPLTSRADTGIRLDRVDDVQIVGNTVTGFGGGLGLGDIGVPDSPPGVTGVTVADNRIYDNRYGIRVRPSVFGTAIYGPLALEANDNWWGANRGPGSTGARPGAPNPVNGVQFVTSANVPVADQGGVTADRFLQLTCNAPATVQTGVPAPVTGQVRGMPTVNSTSSAPPWFVDHAEPFMDATAPGFGSVLGFDQVPDQGPDNAQLTGALVATRTGSGNVFVDLDSERVACRTTATPGPDVVIDKDADRPAVAVGGLVRYRITVRNRGRALARNVRVCDRIPRRTSFRRATRILQLRGHRRCLTIPSLRPGQRVGFSVTLRVLADVPRGRLSNTADVVIPPLPATPAGPPFPAIPSASMPRRKASVLVRVRRAAVRPRFTG